MPAAAPAVLLSDARRDEVGEVGRLAAGTLRAALPPGGAVIVRPDRYVAAVAHDADELRQASADLLSRIRPA